MEQIKKLAGDIDLDEVQRLNPNAYNNYMANLQKQNENIRKMDEYADFVNRERDRINREQLNMNNVNVLNQLNSKQHKQALDYAYQKLRDGKAPSLPAFDQETPTKNRNYNQKQGMRTDPHDSFDEANRLLDNYSGGGDDPLADFMRNPKQNQAQYDDEEYDEPVLQEENYRPRTFNQFPNPRQQQPPPYMPTQYPMQQPYGGGYPQPFQPQPMMPNYMYPYPYPNNFPSPIVNPKDKEKDNELKFSLEKQAMLLETLGKTLEQNLTNKPSSQSESRKKLDSREFERRLQEYERENELKMMLARQQERLEALERERLDKERLRSKQEDKQSVRDELLKDQTKLITGMLNPNVLGGHYMQHLSPFQYNNSPFMMNAMMMNGQYMMNPMYGFNMGLETQQKKGGKKKKKNSKKLEAERLAELEREKERLREEEAARLAREKKAKEEAELEAQRLLRKQRSRAKLRLMLWTMVYPTLFFKDTTIKMVGIRQAVLTGLDSVIRENYEKLGTWLREGMKTAIKSFDELKPEPWDFMKSKDTKRQLKVKEGCLRLVKTLNAITNQNSVGQESLLFLGNISMDSVYIPPGLLSTFEINRLQFSPGLKRLQLNHANGPMQTQMILTCTIIFRLFIYGILLKPWEEYPEFMNKGIVVKTNLKLVASVVYQIAIGYFCQALPVVDYQNYIKQEIEPVKSLFADQDGLMDKNMPGNVDEVINGLFSVTELAGFLSNDAKEILDEIKLWAQTLFEMVLNMWVSTNQKIEECKQNPDDPTNQQNLQLAAQNPLLVGLAQRAMLNGYRNMASTPGDDQIALRE